MSIDGFKKIPRRDVKYQPVKERIQHYNEFLLPVSWNAVQKQASRCMSCGIPFCMGTEDNVNTGCPVQNNIPDWNLLVEEGNWKEALRNLHSTNNFPEFTGKICPAPCERSCTLVLHDAPVTIKTIELAIIEKGWEEQWVVPEHIKKSTNYRVAIVGSGPAGLACAQQLRRAGHYVAVFEKEEKIGGLLRYGIPDFKMHKHDIDRRVAQMKAEGVNFWTNRNVGVDYPVDKLMTSYDAIVLAVGAEDPREIPVKGSSLKGVFFAMDYLTQINKVVAGKQIPEHINVKGKKVVVIGGGDTASDVIGTANRQGAESVINFTHGPKPPENIDVLMTWPYWALELETTTSHKEGCERRWDTGVKRFIGKGGGYVSGIECVKMDNRTPIDGTEFVIPADFVFIAVGFLSPRKSVLLDTLNVKVVNGKIEGHDHVTNIPNVFTAGDARLGASLVVWAIREGRRCARAVDKYLTGYTDLPL